ncbi:MAG TPA: class I SAM-dependent methyltransferase [Candidatus Angelobacter sp.]|nr:class I SAM-dependent methyltransferase [Candidatus Angelobacter sp.]
MSVLTNQSSSSPSSPSCSKSERLRNLYYRSRERWQDGTTQFKSMIHSHLPQSAKVLDLGAGSGRNYAHDLRSETRRLVGVDISIEVMANPYLDEAYQCDAAAMPFPSEEFDLAFSDYVFEHLADPPAAIRELHRVLKPGACFILRTPNRWHYVPLAASVLSHPLQSFLLDRFTVRKAEDVFPKFYRCNTERVVLREFEKAGFAMEEFALIEKEPIYLERSELLFKVGVLYERIVNSSERLRGLRSNILAVFRKPLNEGRPKGAK